MPVHIHQQGVTNKQVLTCDFDGLQGQTPEDLRFYWNLFTKCKENLEQGRRLENISWRLWHKSTGLCGDAPHSGSNGRPNTNNNLAQVMKTLPDSLSNYKPKGKRISDSIGEEKSTQIKNIQVHIPPTSSIISTANSKNIIIHPNKQIPISSVQSTLSSTSQEPQTKSSIHLYTLKRPSLPLSKQYQSAPKNKPNFYQIFTQEATKHQSKLPASNTTISSTSPAHEKSGTLQKKGLSLNAKSKQRNFYSSNSEEEDSDYVLSSEEDSLEDISISPESYSAYVKRQERIQTLFTKQLKKQPTQSNKRGVSALTLGLNLANQILPEESCQQAAMEKQKTKSKNGGEVKATLPMQVIENVEMKTTPIQKRHLALQAKLKDGDKKHKLARNNTIGIGFEQSVIHENHW